MDKDLIRACIHMLKRADFSVSYTRNSLFSLEKLILNAFPLGIISNGISLLPFGVYLGETILKNSPNAKWNWNENIYESTIDIEIEEGIKVGIKPFTRIVNFISDNDYGLAVIYDQAKDAKNMYKQYGNAANHLKPGQNSGWIDKKDHTIRIHKPTEEQAREWERNNE